MLDDGPQLLVEPGLHNLRQGVAIALLGPPPGDLHQLLLGPLDEGREVAVGHRADVVDHVGDPVGVRHHHLKGLLLAQVLELLEHLRRGAHVKGRLLVRVREALHDDLAEIRVLGVLKVHVAGGHNRLAQLFANAHNGAVVLPQALLVRVAVAHHKHVVANGLNFQIIVVLRNFAQAFKALSGGHGPKELSRLAGAANEQALPVLVQQAFGNAGIAVVVVQVPLGDEPVEVLEARVVLYQNDLVVGPQLLGVAPGQSLVDVVDGTGPLVLPQAAGQLNENIPQHRRVVIGPVVVKGGQL